MHRTLLACLLAAATILLSTPALSAQTDTESSKSAKLLEKIAWIAGDWHGEAMGGSFEEAWLPPSAGTMVGVFKFIKDGEVGFYELLTIVPTEDDSLVLRLKHFHGDLKGWEEKDKSIEFFIC